MKGIVTILASFLLLSVFLGSLGCSSGDGGNANGRGASDEQTTSESQDDQSGTETVPLVLDIEGLRFPGIEEAVATEVLEGLQRKAPDYVHIILVGDKEEARRQTKFAVLTVNYREEPASCYSIDDADYLRVIPAGSGGYIGTRISARISVDGECHWNHQLNDYDRDFGSQSIYVSAESADALRTELGREEETLRDDAVSRLWSGLKHLPGYLNSIPQAKEESSIGPLGVGQMGARSYRVYGATEMQLGTLVEWSTPTFLCAVDVGRVYLFNGSTGLYTCTDTVTKASWEFSPPQPYGISVPYTPLVVDGATAYVFADKVYALDSTSGEQKWEQDPSGGISTRSAVVLGNLDEDTLYYGQPHVSAVDRATGAIRWSAGGFEWGPTLYSSRVYGGDSYRIFSLDANTGEVLWTQTRDEFEWFHSDWSESFYLDTVNGHPLVANDRVYAITNELSHLQDGSYSTDFSLCAFDVSTGELKWRTRVPEMTADSLRYELLSPNSETVLLDYLDYSNVSHRHMGSLISFNTHDGTILWQYQKNNTITMPLDGIWTNRGLILLQDGAAVHALDVRTGLERWQSIGDSRYFYFNDHAPEGLLYLLTGDIVRCVDQVTGEDRWVMSLNASNLSDGRLYGTIRSRTGDGVCAVDARTGQVDWFYPGGDGLGFSPAWGPQPKIVAQDGIIYLSTVEQLVNEPMKSYVHIVKP